MPEATGLYRKEALRQLRLKPLGSPLSYQGLSAKMLSLVFVGCFVAAIGFLQWGTLKHLVNVRGSLAPISGVVKVYPGSAGIYQQVLVTEGQRVTKGQVLVRIAAKRYDESGGDVDLALLQQLGEQRAEVVRQRTLEQQEYAVRTRALSDQVTGLRREIALAEQEYAVLKVQLELSENEYSINDELYSKRFVPLEQLSNKRGAYYQRLQESKSLTLRLETQRNQLTDLTHRLKSDPLSHAKRLAAFDEQLSLLDQQSTKTESTGSFAITAPSAGTVAALVASNGEASSPETPFLAIIPDNYELQAELYVPSSAIGRVESGQLVRLSYDAFDFMVYGTHEGAVTSISKTSVDPREYLLPVTELKEPVYLVKVRLHKQYVEGETGQHILLQSGGMFSADIVTANRSLLAILFDPIRAVREKV